MYTHDGTAPSSEDAAPGNPGRLTPASILLKSGEHFDASHAVVAAGILTAHGRFFRLSGPEGDRQRRYYGRKPARSWPVGEVRRVDWHSQPGLA